MIVFLIARSLENLCVSLKGNLELSKKLLFSFNDLHVSIPKCSSIREKGEVYERRRFDFCIYLRRTYFVIDLDAGQWKKVFQRTINVIFYNVANLIFMNVIPKTSCIICNFMNIDALTWSANHVLPIMIKILVILFCCYYY